MQIRELDIAGSFEMTPQIHGDHRGAFLEWFRADRFREATGHDLTVAQANCSVSSAGAWQRRYGDREGSASPGPANSRGPLLARTGYRGLRSTSPERTA